MTRTNLRIYFVQCHMQDTVLIMEEGKLNHPHCLACDTFVAWTALNCGHPMMTICVWGEEKKIQRILEEEAWEGAVTTFRDYYKPLETVSSFKYLGHLLTETYDDCMDVISKLWKAMKSWNYMNIILGREGADTRKSGSFYVAVVQSILIFGADTWVEMPRIKCLLGGFHHRVERRI